MMIRVTVSLPDSLESSLKMFVLLSDPQLDIKSLADSTMLFNS